MHLRSVELMGLQTNIFYLKTICWNSLDSFMKYYLLFEKCFSILLEYLLFKKMAFQIIFYLKSGLNHHPQITKKTKQPKVFEQFFTDLPPRKAGVQKYLRPGPTSGGTFALPSSGGHPSPGVNVLLMLHNAPAKTTKNQWDKIFSNRRYCKDHPNVEGFIVGFLNI